MECIICISEYEIFVEYNCKHKICMKCGVRLIFLYKTTNCPLCKQPTRLPIIGREDESQEIVENNIIYRSQDIFNEVKNLVSYKCQECTFTGGSKHELKKHYKEHLYLLCNECLDNRKDFWYEYSLYKVNSLKLHKNGRLNEEGFKGHIYCIHCNIYLYDEAVAKQHCNMIHVSCSVCDILGKRCMYYNGFRELEQHYKRAHYCCTHQQCIKNKCYVFAYKTELFEHLYRFHKDKITLSEIFNNEKCDIPVMEPVYKNSVKTKKKNIVKSKVEKQDKLMSKTSSLFEKLSIVEGTGNFISNASKSNLIYINSLSHKSQKSAIPSYLDRDIIDKMNKNYNCRKALVNKYINKNQESILNILEDTINKNIGIQDCCEQISNLSSPEVTLNLLKEIDFEQVQSSVKDYYKEYKNKVMFPKFESCNINKAKEAKSPSRPLNMNDKEINENDLEWFNEVPDPIPGMFYIEPKIKKDFKDFDDSLEHTLLPRIYTDVMEIINVDYMKIVLDSINEKEVGNKSSSVSEKKIGLYKHDNEYDYQKYIEESFDDISITEHPVDPSIKVSEVYDVLPDASVNKLVVLQSENEMLEVGTDFKIEDNPNSNLYKNIIGNNNTRYESIRYKNNNYVLLEVRDNKIYYNDIENIIRYKK